VNTRERLLYLQEDLATWEDRRRRARWSLAAYRLYNCTAMDEALGEILSEKNRLEQTEAFASEARREPKNKRTTGGARGDGTVKGHDSTTDCGVTGSDQPYCAENTQYCPTVTQHNENTCQAGCQPSNAPANTCQDSCYGTCDATICPWANTCFGQGGHTCETSM
jgi:hypothetical protein